jgi:hypothetical protein
MSSLMKLNMVSSQSLFDESMGEGEGKRERGLFGWVQDRSSGREHTRMIMTISILCYMKSNQFHSHHSLFSSYNVRFYFMPFSQVNRGPPYVCTKEGMLEVIWIYVPNANVQEEADTAAPKFPAASTARTAKDQVPEDRES